MKQWHKGAAYREALKTLLIPIFLSTEQAMEDVTVALRVQRGLRPGQDNNFAVVSQETYLASINSMTLILRVVMIAP